MKTLTKKMTKILTVACLFVMLFTMLTAACAEGAAWHCDHCDADLETEFCPICGEERPAVEEPAEAEEPEEAVTAWTCPVCGEVLPMEYNFCPNDRTEKVVSSGKWPVRIFEGTSVTMNSRGKTVKEQTYMGPGRKYAQGGSFYKGSIRNMTALLKEGSFILVDMEYASSGKRCVYFKSSALNGSAEQVGNMTAYPAVVTADVQPMQGPGKDYDPVKRTVIRKHTKKTYGKSDADEGSSVKSGGDNTIHSGKTETYTTLHSDEIVLAKDAEISAFFEMNGWVYTEFECSAGWIRAWIPAAMVSDK